jgi:photosystem II stability/assembly factor-like uncharacterized protein
MKDLWNRAAVLLCVTGLCVTLMAGVLSLRRPPEGQLGLTAVEAVSSGKSEKFVRSRKPERVAPIRAVTEPVFASDTTAWLQNYKGELLFSRDSGEHWITIGGATPKTFDAFTMIDNAQGWAVDYAGSVWSTRDGGHHWNRIGALEVTPEDPYMGAVQILFVDNFKGWIVDTFAVWATVDGGSSWREVKDLSYNALKKQVKQLRFIDAAAGWAICEGGTLLKTDDSGQHWRSLRDNLAFDRGTNINTLEFVDPEHGWLAAVDAPKPYSENVLLTTSDGGKTWNSHPALKRQVSIMKFFFLDSTNGWMAGGQETSDSNSRGALFRTLDGGKTWIKEDTVPTDDVIRFVSFSSKDEGWLSTDYAVFRTHDSGKTWASMLAYPEVKERNRQLLE